MDNCGKMLFYMLVITLQLYNDTKFDLSSGHVTLLKVRFYTPPISQGVKDDKKWVQSECFGKPVRIKFVWVTLS